LFFTLWFQPRRSGGKPRCKGFGEGYRSNVSRAKKKVIPHR
jgi:hypothetical protein